MKFTKFTLIFLLLYCLNGFSQIPSYYYGINFNQNGQEISLPRNSNYLDVQELSDGIYFLRIVVREEVSSFNFIKN